MSSSKPATDEARHIIETVEAIAALYENAERDLNSHRRGIEQLAARLARPLSLYALLLFVALWIAGNALLTHFGRYAFDPPPFALLQGIVSVGALAMALVLLIRQDRIARLSDRRAHLDLEVNMLAEKKIAKAISLLEEMRRDDPGIADRDDPEAEAMGRPADPEVVSRALEVELAERKAMR